MPTRIYASLALLGAALGAAACADREPLSTGSQETPEAAAPEGTHGQRLYCTVNVRGGTLSCSGVTPSGIRGAIIGGQGQFVKLTSTNVLFDGTAHTLSADVTVQNLLPYTLGTRDGATTDSGGVKVFFHSGPTTTSGSGAVSVANPDGIGAFTATGQPFFKYVGKLAPGGVTAPKHWVFAVEPGVETFSFSVFVYAETQPSASRVLAPQPGDVVSADSLTVVVTANEPPTVSFIRATVGAKSAFLTYAGDRQWSGKVGLSGLTGQNQTLRVAVVAPADSLVHLVPFVFTQVPDLVLTAPIEGTVARPTLRIAGSCTDDTPCTITARIGAATLFTTTGSSFDQTVSLAAYEGQSVLLTVTATDAQGNSEVERHTIFVESSPKLVEVASMGVQVLDADSTRILFRDSTAAGQELALFDVPSGVRTLIHPLLPGKTVVNAFLTPAGAIVSVYNGAAPFIDSIFELRGGTAVPPVPSSHNRLRVAEEWTAWHAGTATLYRRNTTTGFQEVVNPDGTEGDPAANGDVAFTSHGIAYWYHSAGGTTQQLAAGSVPRTDGTQVLYVRVGGTVIYRHDGVTETPIGNFTGLDHSKPRYAVNGGWAVYVAQATDATRQLFSRAPDGTVRQVSTNGAVQVDAVSTTGQVVYTAGTTRYFSAPPYTTSTAIGHAWGNQVRFHGATAYTAIGRTGFRSVP